MTVADLRIVYRDPRKLVAYERNSRLHSPEQIEALRRSIREFGFTNPALLKDDGVTIGAGHARVQAAIAEGLTKIPTITLSGLSESQWRAYVISDNQLALAGSSWNPELLRLELSDLKAVNFDLGVIGFSKLELKDIFADPEPEAYSGDIKAPIYEPSGEAPPIATLFDEAKALALRAEIDAAKLPAELAAFLRAAADRHTVFDFHKIADFYANAETPVQRLMEKSALVIVDFDSAIEHGFVKLSERLRSLAIKRVRDAG